MSKRYLSAILLILCISMYSYSIDAWIRINQRGYLPAAQKKAVFISESLQSLQQFSIHDALTNKELEVFNSIINKGEFQKFKCSFILDFSKFSMQGPFYIKAGLIYSPTIYTNKNVYLGTSDFLLNYLRQQRIIETKTELSSAPANTHYISLGESIIPFDISKPAIEEKKTSKSKSKNNTSDEAALSLSSFIDVKGGWGNNPDKIQYSDITANAVYQLLFAYQMTPTAFGDLYSSEGKKTSNGIPDILDEAKWGLQWLLKMYPSKDSLYVQLNDDSKNSQYIFSTVNKSNNKLSTTLIAQPAFLATGKAQGLYSNKNQTTGLASLAGKFSSAFALGALLFEKSDPLFSSTLSTKASEVYELGRNNPGVCQTIPGEKSNYHQEANWSDDMELAAMILYRTTYDAKYLDQALEYARIEPITPWLCSRTANYYQWYPYINTGHYHLASAENPRYKKEFTLNIQNGLERMRLYALDNPFDVGIPFVENSNNLITSLATQCKLYRSSTNDSTYQDMETALVDWLFGRNPWGTIMINELGEYGNKATLTQFELNTLNSNTSKGSLTHGAINKDLYKSLTDDELSSQVGNNKLQSEWAVYRPNNENDLTIMPSLDGTTALNYILAEKQKEGVGEKTIDKNHYLHGGIVKSDSTKKQITLVFSGHEFADGYKSIKKTLNRLNIKASFFFTGDFYRKRKFKSEIKGLIKEGHYLGAQSNKHLLYSSFQNRDSLIINKSQFISDLRENYKAMEKFGIDKNQSQFIVPSYEWYNDSISTWCREVGIQLINPTPGTLSNMDNSIPEMRQNYFSSTEIINRITQIESKEGLNGYILLFHVGVDKRRQDKFYKQLYGFLIELSKRGYDFVDLYKATDSIDKIKLNEKDKKNKRKN